MSQGKTIIGDISILPSSHATLQEARIAGLNISHLVFSLINFPLRPPFIVDFTASYVSFAEGSFMVVWLTQSKPSPILPQMGGTHYLEIVVVGY